MKDALHVKRHKNVKIKICKNRGTMYNNNEREVGSYECGEEQRRDNRELQELFRNERRQTDEQVINSEILEDKEKRKREQNVGTY